MRANHFAALIFVSTSLLSCSKKENNNDEQLSSISQSIATSAELPTCSAENVSQVFYVEEQSKLVVCNGTKFVEIKGEKGDQGETGAAGSPANSAVWVYDADKKPVAVVLDSTRGLVLFVNGGVAAINFATGAWKSAIAIHSSGTLISFDEDPGVTCAYTESNCAVSQCYQATSSNIAGLVKGSLYKVGTNYYVVNGDEAVIPSVPIKSLQNGVGAACNDFSGTANPADSYAITKIYSFPDGVTLPLKTPLSFGLKTEQ